MNVKQIIPILCIAIGCLITLISGVVFFIALKPIIKSQISKELIIGEHFPAFANFKVAPITMRFSVTFFNITNTDAFDGRSVKSLHFEPVGPYVWDETREKINITFDQSGDRVRYRQVKRFTFNETLSGGRKVTDYVNIANIILATKMNEYAEKMSLTDTVDHFLFKGTGLLLGKSLLKNPSISEPIEVSTGKDNLDQILQTVSYNNQSSFTAWRPNTTCNTIRGTDGTEFHPYAHKSDILYVFEPAACQAVKLVNDESLLPSEDVQGIPVRRFYPAPKDEATRRCYCLEDDLSACPPDTTNIKTCNAEFKSMDLNLIVSSPFFFHHQDLLAETGLDEPENFTVQNYGTYLDVERVTGMVLRAYSRIQLNLLVKRANDTIVSHLSKSSEYMPIAWVEEYGEVDGANAELLRSQLQPITYLSIALIVAIIVGLLLVVSCFFVFISLATKPKIGTKDY